LFGIGYFHRELDRLATTLRPPNSSETHAEQSEGSRFRNVRSNWSVPNTGAEDIEYWLANDGSMDMNGSIVVVTEPPETVNQSKGSKKVHCIHETVDHAAEYVSGMVHTNGMENFWSLFKRGLLRVSRKELLQLKDASPDNPE
jgi:hypothetical protein